MHSLFGAGQTTKEVYDAFQESPVVTVNKVINAFQKFSKFI
jgi:hypothetical protein